VTIAPKPCKGDTVSGNLPEHNLSAAKHLLDSAGWKVGPGAIRQKNGKKLSLTLIHETSADQIGSAAELAVKEWKDLGVAVTEKPQTDTEVNTTIFSTGAWDIGWITITIQLPSQLVPFASGAEPPNGTNFAHIKNADYTRLVTQAATKPGDTGCPQWNAAEVALVKQSDFVPYYDSVAPTWTNKATYKDIGGGPVPTSLRLLAGQ